MNLNITCLPIMKKLRLLLIGEYMHDDHRNSTAVVTASAEYALKKTGEVIHKQLGVGEADANGYVSFDLFKALPEEQEIELRHLWLDIAGEREGKRDILYEYRTSKNANLLLIHVPEPVGDTGHALQV